MRRIIKNPVTRSKSNNPQVAPKSVKSAKDATFKNDKRLSTTSERYKGYLIVLDRGGDGYNVYDKHRELEDSGYPSKEAAKNFIDELVANDGIYSADDVDDIESEFQRIDRSGTGEEVAIAAIMYNLGTTMREAREILPTLSEDKIKDYVDYYYLRDLPRSKRIEIWNNRKNISSSNVKASNDYINSAYEYDVSDWRELASKSVEDSDGFNTDYTLYTNGETYICMFGDKDLYEPDASYADYETESEQDAWDWFNSYTGFADEEDDNDLVFIDPEFDEYDVYGSSVKASTGEYYYFGKDAADKYGNLIADHLKGKSVSKRKSTANAPGGLIYEANKLGIDMWDLLEALEGMCADGRAEEIDDSTYKILGSSNINASRYDEKQLAIEELAMSGEISLGNCSKSTLYRWRNEINDRLQISKYDWRVKANPKDNSLIAVPLNEVNSNCDVYSSEDFDDYEDDIQEISQEFTSENTSINSNKLPAIFKMVSFEPGTTNIDYGGGRFDNVADYLTQYDVINLVYDPYNRTPEHNKEVIKTLRRAGGADTATCSNVLNVIKEPEVRKNVLENISKIVKPGGKVYITVYEGSGKGDEGPTKAGYQLNRRTADYLDEIREVFPDATRKGKLIVATNSRTVNSSTNIKASSTEGYVYTYCDECGKKNRVKVTFNNFNEPFNDTEYKCKYCGARNLLTDPHLYDENGYVVEASQSSSSVEARSYGGAYDVDPEQYFTRGDLVEFADDVISCIANSQDILFDVSELYIEGNNITLGLTNTNNGGGFEHTVTFTVDMRKIRNPWDLQTKYSQKIASMFIDEYNKAIEEDEIYSSKQPNSKLNQIRDKITKVVKNVMMFEAGFSEDEVEEYSVVEVDPSGKVEVRAEVDYDGLMSLCDALNPIVQRYDKDSYFEPVQPGIIQAWVNTQNDVIESSTTSSSGYWYFTRHGVQPGSVPKYVNILDIVDTPEGSYFLADGVISTDDLRNYEIKERKPKSAVVEASKSPNSVANKYPEYMKVSRGGQNFSVHYNLIDNSPSADAHQMWLEFQASVSAIKPYDDAEYAWAQIENGHINVIKGGKVIQQYYYFDADDMDVENSEWCDAIIEQAIDYISEINDKVESRMVHNSTSTQGETIEAGYYDVPDHDLEPPDTYGPVDLEDVESVVEFPLDVTIIMDRNGNWDYEDTTYAFAAPSGQVGVYWVDEEYGIPLGDEIDTVDDLDTLLMPLLPAEVGRYHISGKVKLVYDISEIYAYYTGYDEDSVDREIVKDDANVKFNSNKSKIYDFKWSKLS